MGSQPQLRDQAMGRWPEILQHLGIPEVLLSKRHQACPFCSHGEGKSDRFRFTDHAGRGYFVCNQCMDQPMDGIDFACQYLQISFATVARKIRAFLASNPSPRYTRQTDSEKSAEERRIARGLTLIWRQTRAIKPGDPVYCYLKARGLEQAYTGPALRYHPSLIYYDRLDDGTLQNIGAFPAMVAQYRTPAGRPATLHLTYLTDDGQKADVPASRKVRSPVRSMVGGAVRLYPNRSGGVVSVGEGVETMLAVGEVFPEAIPWACLNAGLLEVFQPPEGVTRVAIFGDHDRNYVGQRAMYILAQRLVRQGCAVITAEFPPEPGDDWLDHLNRLKAGVGETQTPSIQPLSTAGFRL